MKIKFSVNSIINTPCRHFSLWRWATFKPLPSISLAISRLVHSIVVCLSVRRDLCRSCPSFFAWNILISSGIKRPISRLEIREWQRERVEVPGFLWLNSGCYHFLWEITQWGWGRYPTEFWMIKSFCVTNKKYCDKNENLRRLAAKQQPDRIILWPVLVV